MKIAGIDLSGPRNAADTYIVLLEEQGNNLNFIEAVAGADDRRIYDSVSRLGNSASIAVGIDAPLSYNPAGGDRPSDAGLRREVLARGRGVGVMPPTMIRMVYLTLRGITLTRGLESLRPAQDVRIVEVHPGACMLLRDAPASDVAGFKRDPAARLRLLDWMEAQGMRGLPRLENTADHFVAACAAALGAWKWASGKSVWIASAEPPLHPYDFAC